MQRVLIFDVETTGLDPSHDEVIEVGWAVWSVECRAIVDCHSFLLGHDSNDAEPFNRISVELLTTCGGDREVAWSLLERDAEMCPVILGHYCNFDRSFLVRAPDSVRSIMSSKYWVCTREDFVWPKTSSSDSLVNTALAHGVAVVGAHRAIHDVLLIVRLLESLGDDVRDRLYLALQRACRPKDDFIAQVSYEERDRAKAAGFKWDGNVWKRRMAIEDAETLSFKTIRASELSP